MTAHSETRPTKAYVDLDALASNFRSSKSFIGPEVKYMAVVKADAYGHGAAVCSLRLESEGIDWFGVAIPEEGAQLREAGVTRPILCLGSFWPGQESLLAKYNLTPVIYDPAAASRLNAFAARRRLTFDVHVKIDTGMGRLGIPSGDAGSFSQLLKGMSSLRVAGLLTHFAAAENPAENTFTGLQIERFDNACEAFRNDGHDPEWIDLANSPAAIAHPASRGNMVRLGGALYGLLDDILAPDIQKPALRPVLSLRSHIAHIKRVASGESLGYGRTFVTERQSLIALVPIGYADGYPRGLSNRASAVVKGRLVPVVGRISMDWTLLDVTGLEDAAPGDDVFLIGGDTADAVTAADLASELGTIGYEITCGISPRVSRVYVGSTRGNS